MDEIQKSGTAKRAPYGEEQHTSFLKWLQETAAKAGQAYQNADEDTPESEMLEQVFSDINSTLGAEQEGKTLFSGEENKLFENERMAEMGGFRHRLSELQHRLRSIAEEYAKTSEARWRPHPEVKEYADRLQTEMDAVRAGMDFLTMGPMTEDEAEESVMFNQNEFTERFDATEYLHDRPDPRVQEEQRIANAIQEHRGIIARRAQLLKDSKTAVNSKEYCELMDLMERVGAGRTEPIPGKNEKEQFAQELYTIHRYTERYLEHKARDGVKKNAYRKLLAVERASNAVLQAARALGNVTVSTETPGETKKLKEISFALDDRLKEKMGDQFTPRDKDFYDIRARNLRRNNAFLSERISSDVIANCIRSVDDCMGKILLKAVENGNETAADTLLAMRQSFLDDPFPVVKEHAAHMEKKGVKPNRIL